MWVSCKYLWYIHISQPNVVILRSVSSYQRISSITYNLKLSLTHLRTAVLSISKNPATRGYPYGVYMSSPCVSW